MGLASGPWVTVLRYQIRGQTDSIRRRRGTRFAKAELLQRTLLPPFVEQIKEYSASRQSGSSLQSVAAPAWPTYWASTFRAL